MNQFHDPRPKHPPTPTILFITPTETVLLPARLLGRSISSYCGLCWIPTLAKKKRVCWTCLEFSEDVSPLLYKVMEKASSKHWERVRLTRLSRWNNHSSCSPFMMACSEATSSCHWLRIWSMASCLVFSDTVATALMVSISEQARASWCWTASSSTRLSSNAALCLFSSSG